MRKLTLFVLHTMLVVISYGQGAQDSAWFFDNYTKKEVMIPMRDGVKLFTSILMPKDASEKHPVLFMRTPYSCAPYGEDKRPAYWNTYYKYYLREGYIIVKQDVRGRWMSEGEFVDVRPFNPNKKTNQDIDESSDTYDAIEWITKNVENNNGNVGVMGISYPGFYSTMAALSGHRALKAVSPQAPVTEWFLGDDFHHNGAFFQMDGFRFYKSFGQPRPLPTTAGPKPYEFPTPDAYDFYLRTGPLKNLTKIMGDSIRFWQDLMSHPNYDTFWKQRNVMNHVTNVKPVMLVVGGLFDAEDCYGAWNLYQAIEKKSPSTDNKIVMGPWYHGQWSSPSGWYLGNIHFGSNTSTWYQDNIEMPFFNYYLKGKGMDPKLAEATIFFTGENKWRKLPSWPVAEKKDVPLYLQANGKLSWNKPTGRGAFSEYVSDPSKPVPYVEAVGTNRTREYMIDDQRFAARRPDVLVFETEVLDKDLTLGGPVIADLLTSISGTDADFVVKLIDVFPDDFEYDPSIMNSMKSDAIMGGFQMLVRGEVMRGKFRNSFETPVPFKPNKTERVKFTLPDVAHTFKKGHKLMIQIQSTWFPLVDRNPQKFVNIYTADESDFQKSTIRIHHDAGNSSSIVLPVIE
ncbi:MAG: CocE/NonD family hydrolase [Chitinophagaceae bacterium]|nr:MAG: CocE/NonD family hydrolase [Chitinophagaceae bacterium]